MCDRPIRPTQPDLGGDQPLALSQPEDERRHGARVHVRQVNEQGAVHARQRDPHRHARRSGDPDLMPGEVATAGRLKGLHGAVDDGDHPDQVRPNPCEAREGIDDGADHAGHRESDQQRKARITDPAVRLTISAAHGRPELERGGKDKKASHRRVTTDQEGMAVKVCELI